MKEEYKMKQAQQLIMALAVVATTALCAPAMAEDAPPAPAVTIGVVDINKVLQASDAGKGIYSELEGKRKEFQAQITKEEDSLRSASQEFEKQKDTLSKDQLQSKHKEIEQKIFNGQRMVQERKAMLDKSFSDTMVKLRNEVGKIVAEIAKEKHLSAVLTEDAVMLSLPEMNMTDEVLKRLNTKVKKIPVEWAAAKKDKKAG
jgi:Skp family chaperone for outer membrane proteins